ncbi:PREDICTED: uncharacterized protein LOC105579750 isoform X3 [Cercocebus atys]|uniref:uncharacterized protein LOC105579750 isoform X3 n=1 Tax=Cercocebus atys TaxID=9531 RepID=UPI0005F411D2|nr:PREDICTED: uncharacterized protein LOC105579750 isoform X3 [Cercocebus atys]
MANMGSLQEVIDWGLIGWKYYASVIGPIQCEGLANVEVTQIACAEKRFLILSHNGRVHTQAYNSDTLAPQLVQGLASRNTVKIAAHSASHHCVALAAAGQVYSWALGTEDGLAMGTLYVSLIPAGDTLSFYVSISWTGWSAEVCAGVFQPPRRAALGWSGTLGYAPSLVMAEELSAHVWRATGIGLSGLLHPVQPWPPSLYSNRIPTVEFARANPTALFLPSQTVPPSPIDKVVPLSLNH